MGAQVKFGSFNIAAMLTDLVKDSFDGFEIYDMVHYEDAQAFMISYQMDMTDSFNPDDYLDDIKGQMGSLDDLNPGGIDPIYPEPITIPKMTTGQISDTWFYFEMGSFFQNMEDQLNTTSAPKTEAQLSYPQNSSSMSVPLPPALSNLPSFMVFKENNQTEANFESAFVHTGEIVLNVWLEGNLDPNLEILLNDIEMKGKNSGYYIGTPKTLQKVQLNFGNNFSEQIVINLAEEEIIKDDPPQFSFSSITSNYSGTLPGLVSFKLAMQPHISGITLRGARGLKLGEMDQNLPDEIIDSIKMEPVKDLLNAKIMQGEFRISTEFPPYEENEVIQKTGCSGIRIEYELFIEQEPVVFQGEPFIGLTDRFTDTNDTLSGKFISGNSMSVNQSRSKLIIKTDTEGATFKLFNDDGFDGRLPLTEKVLPIKMDMGLNIEELEVVRWKMKNDEAGESIIPAIEVPPINFANIGNQDISFIKSITFEQIVLDLDFTVPSPPPLPPTANHGTLQPGPGLPKALEKRLALKINCSDFGFNDTTKILQSGSNFFTGEPAVLSINDETTGKAKSVVFDITLIPVINGEPREDAQYMEFGPVVMSSEDIKMNIYAESNIDFTWKEAAIDLKAALESSGTDTGLLEGTFPEKNKDPVNLSTLGKYMTGITIGDNIQAKMFMGGPRKLIETINPALAFSAEWENENSEEMFNDSLTVYNTDELPKLSDLLEEASGGMVYAGTELPDGGITITGSFGNVLKDSPKELRFSYRMILPTEPITVYPDTFDNAGGGGGIKAMILLVLPLELAVSEGACFSIPNSIFGDLDGSKDLFGRKSTDGERPDGPSPFTDININSLGIRIDFEQAFFSGAHLFMDKDNILFGDDGLNLSKGNSLAITFTKEQRKKIDENMIYPDIRIMFHEETTIKTSRNFMPTRIAIAASGSYRLNLDDIGLGN
ncbi:MAG: hypothetical protein FWC24_04350 [Treponema sp.]|nr:hypothetical protein [Treponema sp.]